MQLASFKFILTNQREAVKILNNVDPEKASSLDEKIPDKIPDVKT